MPYPEEDLAKELKQRKAENRPFSNKEITFLLYDVINGLSHMQQLGFVHGNLSPEFIARTTTGYAMMEDPLLNQFRMLNLREKINWYLSPKGYLSALKGKPCGKDYNINKSDVFSAGLILLETALNKSVQDIYGKHGINSKILKSHIEELNRNYPDNNLLVSTLKKMLEYNESKRPDFIEIHQKLPPYRTVKEYFRNNPSADYNQGGINGTSVKFDNL